jgi:hypothetical protein
MKRYKCRENEQMPIQYVCMYVYTRIHAHNIVLLQIFQFEINCYDKNNLQKMIDMRFVWVFAFTTNTMQTTDGTSCYERTKVGEILILFFCSTFL